MNETLRYIPSLHKVVKTYSVNLRNRKNIFTLMCIERTVSLNNFLNTCYACNGTPLQYSCLENPMDRGALVGCSPWGREELDPTEGLHFQFSLSCIGEGNGNPLQCSCLENPRDGEAWWAAVYGVAQSWTQLKRVSSSSSRKIWSPEGKENYFSL